MRVTNLKGRAGLDEAGSPHHRPCAEIAIRQPGTSLPANPAGKLGTHLTRRPRTLPPPRAAPHHLPLPTAHRRIASDLPPQVPLPSVLRLWRHVHGLAALLAPEQRLDRQLQLVLFPAMMLVAGELAQSPPARAPLRTADTFDCAPLPSTACPRSRRQI